MPVDKRVGTRAHTNLTVHLYLLSCRHKAEVAQISSTQVHRSLRHLPSMHPKQEAVKTLTSLSRKSNEQRQLLIQLTKKGNY